MEPGDLGLRLSPQGEEGPPSLEYIQAKDLFPPKELVKEEENLQVRRSWGPRVGGAPCLVKKYPPSPQVSLRGSSTRVLASCSPVSEGKAVCGVCLHCIMEPLAPGKARQLSCTAVAWCCCYGEDSSVLPWPSFSRGDPTGQGQERGMEG